MAEITISDYKNCESVGAGKTGEVFRAACPRDGSPKAVKRLNSMAIDREILEDTCRRHARAPRHPGVVPVSDFQFDQTPYYIATDWIEAASTLEDLPAPMSEAEAWTAIRDLADSMAHLHKHGVLHGNLHPGNVFVTGGGGESSVQVTDCGPGLVGKIHHIDIAETAWFAPPEQLENPGEHGDGALGRWDVYRFGALAFWLIDGEAPRGHACARARREAVDASGGRPVPYDLAALAADVRANPEFSWTAPAECRAHQLRRDLIERCLAIDPDERPVDMREVQEAFENLETRFALEDAEVRVVRERQRQTRKLRFSRTIAACLAASLLAASTLLVMYLNRSKSFRTRVSELGLVVHDQRRRLEDFEVRWSQSLHELSESRAAADSFFSQISQSGATEVFPGDENGRQSENLERSRRYFEKILEALGESPGEKIERARSLHNLARIEARLAHPEAARERYREAAALFETISESRAEEVTLISEFELRLADCYERLAAFIETDPGEALLAALKRAVHFGKKIRERRPEDREIAMRQAMNEFKLGRQLHAHREFDEAIEVFGSAGENVAALREAVPESAVLSEMLSRIQYHAALSLAESGLHREAVDAHLATLETIALAAGDRPYTFDQRRRLARGYTELGVLFSGHAGADETKPLFNEALRLLNSVDEEDRSDPETVLCLSRSMAHIAQLEREGANWNDGYRMSLAAIRRLEAALAERPGHIDCELTLSAIRASHTELLKYNRAAALSCLEKGLDMVASVQDRIDRDESVIAPVRQTWRLRIAKIYDDYQAVCESFGENEKAQMCSDRANRARNLLVVREGEREPLSF